MVAKDTRSTTIGTKTTSVDTSAKIDAANKIFTDKLHNKDPD